MHVSDIVLGKDLDMIFSALSLFILSHTQISRSELAPPKPTSWQWWTLSGSAEVTNVGGIKSKKTNLINFVLVL